MWKKANKYNAGHSLAALSLICLLTLLAGVLAGCSPTTLPPSPEDIQTAIAETAAAQAVKGTPTLPPTYTPTFTPGPTYTPTVPPPPTPIGPISGYVDTDYLNMRSGPGTLFAIIQTFVQDTALTAVSRNAFSDWVEVVIEFENEDQEPLQGWMYVPLLSLDGDPTKLPVTSFPDTQVISGSVKDTDGNPIPGIVIAIVTQINGEDSRTEITSNQDGKFEVTVPEGLPGPFDVQIIAWDCESLVVNLNCRLSGYFILESRAFVFLPQEEPIAFIFESTQLVLEGDVLDAKGNPATGITVIAERDDGAISYGKSDALGKFSMPVSDGIWDVYVVTYAPYAESDPIQIEVVNENPEPVQLITP